MVRNDFSFFLVPKLELKLSFLVLLSQKGDWKPAHKAACKTFVASAHTSYEERRALGQKKIDEGTIVEEDESEEVAKENEIIG